MFSAYRIVNQSCTKRLNLSIVNKYVNTPARAVTMKVISEQPLSKEDFFEKNAKLKRPLSPHLTIYKPQITTILSITNRATGIALASYVTAFGIGALVLPHDWPYYISSLASVGPATLFLGKFAVAFPFAYHFWNGVRHLFWDVGKYFKIKDIYTTGYLMLGATAVSTFALCLM